MTGLLAALALVGAGLVPATAADDKPDISEQDVATGDGRPVRDEDAPSAVPEAERAEVLPRGWASSDDLAWATVGDHHGFHVLTAPASSGYEWGVTATLSEPGIETDEWVGNACVTSSGRFAVVVYAPRSFVNDPDLFDRGALAAVVDLGTGGVTKLSVTASLAYFNPGCGADDLAVITTARADDDQGDTRLVTVDARKGRAGHRASLPGQVTSAIPVTATESLAATGAYISRIGSGDEIVPLAAAGSVPYSLTLDRDGGLSYLSRPRPDADTSVRREAPASPSTTSSQEAGPGSVPVVASRLSPARLARNAKASRLRHPEVYARGTARGISLTASAHGKSTLAGAADVIGDLPPGMTHRPEVESGVGVTGSTHGKVFVSEVGWESDGDVFDEAAVDTLDAPIGSGDTPAPVRTGEAGDPDLPRRASLTMQIPETRSSSELGAPLSAVASRSDDGESGAVTARKTPLTGGSLSPALGEMSVAGMVPEDLVDGPERGCAVTRGDPQLQAMQPRPRQVEWAADQLVEGTLDRAFYPEGPDGWRARVDMPQYTPSELVPLPELAGPGTVGDIPPQILLGIAMSESNMQQAARSVVPGVTGNPLIGNYWGVTDSWDIHFRDVDCGYGVMQVTDGMELGDHRDPGEQRAIALDYVANIQAGAAILIEKWNQTYNAGMLIHGGDPSRIENWFYALWAYNSGFYPESTAGENNGAWGVGWHNNPANPKYPPDRDPFLQDNDFEDGRTPNLWTYPERSLGFAAWSSELIDGVGVTAPGFRPARWTLNEHRATIKPEIDTFCDETNRCDKDLVGDVYTPPGTPETPGPCYSESGDNFDYKCWYHEPASWKEYCEPGTGTPSPTCGEGFIRFPGAWDDDDNPRDEDPYRDGIQPNGHSPSYDEEENQRSYPPNCSETPSERTNSAPPNSWIVDDVPHGTPAVKPCARSSSDGTFSWQFNQAPDGTFPPKRDIHQIGAGWQGHFYFSHTRTGEAGGTGIQLRAEGTWTLGRSHDGWMRIAVHLPDHGAHTQQARYDIDLDGDGATDRTRYINQRRMANNWVSLGSYEVDGIPSVTLSNVTVDGEGTQDIAWDAIAFQPLDQEPIKIAVLGDSFSSGEGTGFAAEAGPAGYYPETNVDGDLQGTAGERWQNSCRRSPDAWARKITVPGTSATVGFLSDSWSSEVELGFVACSGAQTKDLLDVPWGDGVGSQYGEVRQARSGVLSDETDLVLFTIGGNDGDLFTSIVTDCITLPACQTRPPLDTAYDQVDDHTLPAFENVVNVIGSGAPNAQIVLGTYPELFSYDPDVIELCWIEPGEASHILALQAYYSGRVEEIMTRLYHDGLNVSLAYAEEEFRGHDTCVLDSGFENWINPPIFSSQGAGDSQGATSRASIHPNDLGTDAYARAFDEALRSGWPPSPALGG